MADFKTSYSSSNQPITCGFSSLASGASRQSAAIDNGTNKFLDALVFLSIQGPSTALSTGYVLIYAYGTADSGATYTDGATGSDAAMTPTSPTNLKLIGYANVVASSVVYKVGPFSVAKGFDGVLPEKWGIVVTNGTGNALQTCSAFYQGIMNTYA